MKTATAAIISWPFVLDFLLNYYSDALTSLEARKSGLFLILLALSVWGFAVLLCLIWGGYILRRHRLLGWCCIGVGLFHLYAFIWPAIPSSLGYANANKLFSIGLGVGILGVVFLFFARLPFYQQKRFWTFGLRELDRFHRRLYGLAYLFVVISITLLLIVWSRLR